MNVTNQLLVYADEIHLLIHNINTIKNTDIILVGSKDVRLDEHCENQVRYHTTQTECRTKSQLKVSPYIH
jgi:hypothetical protein